MPRTISFDELPARLVPLWRSVETLSQDEQTIQAYEEREQAVAIPDGEAAAA